MGTGIAKLRRKRELVRLRASTKVLFMSEGELITIPMEVCVICQDIGGSSLDVYVGLERTRQHVLRDYGGNSNKPFIATQHMISQRTACSIKTIQRCIPLMEEAGLVEVERPKIRGANGTIKNEPNMYRLKTHGMGG